MKSEDYRKNEVAFCADVSKWADQFFLSRSELPFGTSDIESYGRGSQKRHDLRFYERSKRGRGKLALSAEVKLPGTAHGRSPFDPALVQDAFEKADRAVCRYFFTWNVEHLALFDRSLFDRPLYERCIGQWPLGLELNRPTDVERPDVKARLYGEFLPRFFSDFADIYLQRRKDFALPLSDLYITVLESHLGGPMGPVRELRDFLTGECERSKPFESQFLKWLGQQQWNFNRNEPDSWQETVDRAARSMVYVLSNRILFYQAVRLRYELPALVLPTKAKTPEQALAYLHARFGDAVFKTGDYEPVFFPDGKEEWAARTALSGENSLDSWGRVIRGIEKFSFDQIPSDVLGGIFQKLISPEERHKFGQHYTDENIVDVINAFCIRRAESTVFDPACGSGSFLVRAYYRKAQMPGKPKHDELLEGLYGCDINPFPAHLATLNLAARNISQQENYPRVVRKNFFKVAPGTPFCEIPTEALNKEGEREREEIYLPELDAIVGNPPYVRQELIARANQKGAVKDQTKEYILEVVERAWPGISLSRQSDLHVYFWPVATQFLKDGGWFGFLTSSSWLDVRYGFALQRWVLLNFEVIAVLESVHEPWFEDARVKTAVTVLRKCTDQSKRDTNVVRFVRIKRPLGEILGERTDEEQRQSAANSFRDLIVRAKADFSDDHLRIMVKKQADLWKDGLSVAEMFARQRAVAGQAVTSESELEQVDDDENGGDVPPEDTSASTLPLDYGGGKWGRYLRAPDLYFEVMREYGHRFTRFGDVATIKFGIKSGCDAFFMPRDVSYKLLDDYETELAWRALPLMPYCKRAEVAKGSIAIVECGDKTIHPIERKFLRPEVHNLMQVDRPLVSQEQTDRVVLWVSEALGEIEGTYAERYIRWGAKQKFASEKSKAKFVPERPTCKGRDPWYDLTGLKPGIALWPMAQQYRHIIPANTEGLPCNHNLFDVHALALEPPALRALVPVLNCTLVALFKTFYGRYAGTEGNLKTEVVDTFLLEIPDPRRATEPVLAKLETALASMQKREVSELLEASLRKCTTTEEVLKAERMPLTLPVELRQGDRRQLDDAVFELLGVAEESRRGELIDRLYREMTLHTRSVRVVEVQKMEQRRHGGSVERVNQLELALDGWQALDPEWRTPLAEWLEQNARLPKVINLPEGAVRLPDAGNFFEATTVYFGQKPALSLVCAHRAEAELISAIASEGLRGPVSVPSGQQDCAELRAALEERLTGARARFEDVAAERAGTDELRERVVDLLHKWFVSGNDTNKTDSPPSSKPVHAS